MVNYCTVCFNNTRRHTDISFFIYPKDRERRNEWLKTVCREDLITKLDDDRKRPNYKICEEHFETTCITFSKTGNVKYLSVYAFPTLNLPTMMNIGASTSQSQNELWHHDQSIQNISVANEPVCSNTLEKEISMLSDTISLSVANEPVCSNTPKKELSMLSDTISRSVANEPVCSNTLEKEISSLSDTTSCSVQTDDVPNTEIINRIGCDSRQSQTALSLSANSPRKRKLRQQLKESKRAKPDLNKVTKTDFLKLCDKFMSKSMSQLIKWQINLIRGSSGNRHSDAFKFFALSLHYSGPAAYRFLRNTFCLPSLTTLRNLVMPIGTKIDERILTALKTKVNRMVPQEKICSVSVDCMSLKENICYDIRNDRIIGFHEINGQQKPFFAKYVIVIMIRGIIVGWKQPVAYSFLAQCKNYPDVSSWIDEIISLLIEIGLDVRAFISDLGSDFVSASKSRAVNVDKTYFEVDGHKIYYVFDVPHLTKCVRNNLKTCDFIYDGHKVAKWSDIRDMYNHDKKNVLRLAHKLTDIHMNPNNFLKMRVKLAVQVLSHTVSAAIKTYIDLKLMDPSARDTAEFVDKINKLFDILNSSTLRSPNKFKRAYCGEAFQIQFLQEMLDFFKNLNLRKIGTKADVTKTMNFIRGFQISIKSLMNLFEDLQSIGVKFILTRRINQDALENFFGKVRQAGGSCQEPTCYQLANAFKKLFVCSILKTTDGTNCQEDFDSLLMKYEDCQPFSEASQATTEITSIAVGTSDYQFKLPVQNAIVYVSGYLYKKCIERHKCEKMMTYVNRSEQPINMTNDSLFSHYKDYNDAHVQSGFLIIPPDNFVAFIGMLERKFCQYFDLEQNGTNIGNGILKLIEHCTFEMPCYCFPINYLKKLYIRLRIYHTIKQNNRNLKNKNFRKKLFRVCHL